MEYEARREVGRDERDGTRGQKSEVRSQMKEDFLSVVSGPLSVANKAGGVAVIRY